MSFMIKEENTVYSVADGMKTESDDGALDHQAGNTGTVGPPCECAVSKGDATGNLQVEQPRFFQFILGKLPE